MLATDILDRLSGGDSRETAMRWDVRVEVMADEIGSATGKALSLDVIAAAEQSGRLILICDNQMRHRSGQWGYNELACMLRGKGRQGREVAILIPISDATFTDLGDIATLELQPATVCVDPRNGLMTISVKDIGNGLDAHGDKRPRSYACSRIRPFGLAQRKIA